jgi:type I restriction enzyme S subunit
MGARRDSVSPKTFLAHRIPLPPPAEQRRIVARIEELAAKIEEARRLRNTAVEETSALRASAAREAFAIDNERAPLDTLCLAIIDNLHSNPVYADSGVPCIRSSDVGWGELFLHTARRTSEAEYKRRTVRGEPATNDIVLVREGGGTGKAALVKQGVRFSLGQRVLMLRPDPKKVLPKFLLLQLLSPRIYEDRVLAACTGSASPHLNIGDLRRFDFMVPPIEQQRRIVAHLESIWGLADQLTHKQSGASAELDALLPSILDKAFKGEL